MGKDLYFCTLECYIMKNINLCGKFTGLYLYGDLYVAEKFMRGEEYGGVGYLNDEEKNEFDNYNNL